jgi:hypothetical protein
MGTPSGNSSLDFHDPLHDTPQLELGNADELISQLAGDDIDRLISSDDNLTPLTESDLALNPVEKPSVEELAARLDQVFQDIRNRAPSPPPVRIDLTAPEPMTLPEPVLAMRRFEEAEAREARELEHRRSLLDPIEDTPPAVIRCLAWLNAPVAQLARGPRVLVSAVSLVSFVGSVAALAYVLMLRRGI